MSIYRGQGGAPSATDSISLNQIIQLETDAGLSASAAEASATAASASASAASISESNSASSALLTAADALSTEADVVLTNADVVLTHADVVLTNADVASTAANLLATGLDTDATAEDVIATAADVLLTNADVVSTNADVVLTHADVLLTAADALATASDASTASTAASNAATSASNASTSESNALASADAAALSVIASAADFNIPSRNSVQNQEPVTQGTSTRTGMSSTIYTGSGTSQAVSTGVDMATGDFGGLVWVKERTSPSTINSHVLQDTVRGTNSQIFSNFTNAEQTNVDRVTSYDSTGFSLGANVAVNENTGTFVAWSLQTNQKTTGTTNRNKAYTAHYNTDLGFSIVGYVGDGVAGHEIPHHLGVEPELSITKSRDNTLNWEVQGSILGDKYQYLRLNTTGALGTATTLTTLASASTLQLGEGASNNGAADNFISYHFASKAGVSKVGKYIGTGAAGNYVDCGFKVGWLMVKNLTTAQNWAIVDLVRGDNALFANLSNADAAYTIERTPDGFALIDGNGIVNTLNNEYIFLAFAETNTDATKSWTDYDYATTQDTLSIAQNTLISFANGFSASGQQDTQENVGAGVTYTLGVGHEDKHYWLYKDKAGSYGVSEHRPLEGVTRNDADTWGEVSPLDVSLRTTAKHFGYESSTGVALASGEWATAYAYQALDKSPSIANTYWMIDSTTTSWLQYKLSEKRILKSWRMSERSVVNQIPKRFTIEGSNDGFTWTAIDSTYTASDYIGNGINLWGDIQLTSGNTTAYLYHRINITANSGAATYTSIAELEFNTILPSDYYLVNEGIQYNNAGTAIERTYLAELMTNTDGEVSWYRNLPVAKQRFNSVDVHGDLLVKGEISNRGVATAWVNFDGTQNPPLIRDSFNVKDVVDLGTGQYKFIFGDPMKGLGYSYSMAADLHTDGGTKSESSLIIVTRAIGTTTVTDSNDVSITVFGGK